MKDTEGNNREEKESFLEKYHTRADIKEGLENGTLPDDFFDKIPEEAMVKLFEQAEEVIKAYQGDNWETIPEENRLEVIKQLYKKPTTFTQPLVKLVEGLFDSDNDFSELQSIVVSPKNAKEEAFVKARVIDESAGVIDIDRGVVGEALKPFTAYEREIFSGICTIYATGQHSMTTRQIYEAMAGKSTTSENALESIRETMRKFRARTLIFDYEEHARLNGIEVKPIYKNGVKIKPFLEEGSVVASRLEIAEVNGEITPVWRILEKPGLLRYAENVGQISVTSTKMLCIPAISNTQDNIKLKNYLIRHVEHIRVNKRYNPVLKFETIFKKCEIAGDGKKMKLKRDTIFNILNWWKTEPGEAVTDYEGNKTGEIKDETERYITGYKVNRKGRVFYSIEIVV